MLQSQKVSKPMPQARTGSRLAGGAVTILLHLPVVLALFWGLRQPRPFLPQPLFAIVIPAKPVVPELTPGMPHMASIIVPQPVVPAIIIAEDAIVPSSSGTGGAGAAPQIAKAPAAVCAVQAYMQQLQVHLQNSLRYPLMAQRQNEQGPALVHISFDRGGTLLSVALVKSTGYNELDWEAVALVKRAQPLPAIPDCFHMTQLSTDLPVNFALR